MFARRLTILKFKLNQDDRALVERAMSSIRGNFGSEKSLVEERGKALVMMARIVLSDYKVSEPD